ncbi:hypothetical protein DUGA6_63220 [Duganella sp. HH105]|nr:hypothetical protein DUGA6_63220 [Duganella sp. HH105]
MVHHHHQDIPADRLANQANAKQRTLLQVERCLMQTHRFLAHARSQFAGRHAIEIDPFNGCLASLFNQLHYLAIQSGTEHCPQRFVPRYQRIK